MADDEREDGMPPPVAPEYPDADRIRAYGELTFLAMRYDAWRRLPVEVLRLALQPAIDLNFHRVFRREGVPRAAVTWAFLSPDAERRFARGGMLAPRDWNSGARMWVMDIIAPYGQGTGAHAMNWLRQKLPPRIESVRWLRTSHGRDRIRVMEARRLANGRWGTRVLPVGHLDTAANACTPRSAAERRVA